MNELSLHMAVASFLRVALPADVLWTHFPAGEARDERVGAKLKAMGLAKGWPDFILVLPGGHFAGIELKGPTGRLSPDQEHFRDRINHIGGLWAEARSLEGVADVLRLWGVKLRAEVRAA
jgi:hypothetical protein